MPLFIPQIPDDLATLAQLTGLKSTTVGVVNVTTGNEVRPSGFQMIIWLGGTTRPTNMANGDIWFSSGPVVTPVAPAITTSSLNAMVNGTAFTQTLAVTGTTPITFAVTSGALPSWMSLNTSTGTLSGIPNATGTYDFTITASNSVGNSTPVRYQGTIAAAGTAPSITTSSLPAMTQNAAYDSGALVVTGSTPITFGVSAGTLPAGLSINSSTGTISGTPTVSGAYNFTVQATNSFGNSTRQFTGTITAAASGGTKSIFLTSAPGTSQSVGSDGGGNLRIAQMFYSSSALPNYRVLGLRIYRPAADSGFASIGGTAYLYATPWTNFSSAPPTPTALTPLQSKAFPAGSAGGWQDVLFDTPLTMHSATLGSDGNDAVWLGVQFAGGNHYGLVTGLAANGVNRDGLYLGDDSGSQRGWNNIMNGAVATYYGIDILFEEI